MRDAFRELSSEKDYRYWYDPFWVRAQPYRVVVRPGEDAGATLHLRNFQAGRCSYRIELHTPTDLVAHASVLEGAINGESRVRLPLRLTAAPAARLGVHLLAFDVTLGGRRYGERFDLIISVE
jgi:hypothetical protein